MIYRTGQGIDGSKARLSFDAFFKKARNNQANMQGMLEDVLYAREVFKNANILPSQCDRIISALNLIRDVAVDLLDITNRIPATLTPSSYPLIRELHKVNNLLSDLTLLIPQFRASFQTPSYHAIEQQREIQRKFDSLVEAYKNMLQETAILLDIAHFAGAPSK